MAAFLNLRVTQRSFTVDHGVRTKTC